MAKTENRRVEDSFVTTCSSIISGTITFFLFMLVTVFPLIYHRGYADILETKYWTYCVIAIGMAVIVGILALIMLLVAAFVGTWTLVLWICAAVLLTECCVLLFVTRRG